MAEFGDLNPYPIWRVTYRYKDSETLSYDSWPNATAALDAANERIREPDTYSQVRISWPHYASDPPDAA